MNIKKIVLGSALALFATTLNAQEQPWSFGVKAGGGMSWLQGIGDAKFKQNDGKEESGKAKYNWIVSGGPTVGYAFHENVGVGLEVLGSTFGGQVKEDVADKARSISVVVQSLAIPVMVKFFPMGYGSEAGVLDIHAGAQVEIPLSGEVQVSSSADPSKLEEDKSFKKDYLNTLTVSAVAGIGYEFPEIGLKLEGRYSFGFMDTFKDTAEAQAYRSGNGLEKNQKLTNQSLVLSLGYNFATLLMG